MRAPWGRVIGAAMTGAIVALASFSEIAIATPIRAGGLSAGQDDVGIEACRLIAHSGRGYGDACDPALNVDGGVNPLYVGLAHRGFLDLHNLGDLARAGLAPRVPLRLGRPGQGLSPRGRGGIPVTEPATACLLLAGAFAWSRVRRRPG